MDYKPSNIHSCPGERSLETDKDAAISSPNTQRYVEKMSVLRLAPFSFSQSERERLCAIREGFLLTAVDISAFWDLEPLLSQQVSHVPFGHKLMIKVMEEENPSNGFTQGLALTAQNGMHGRFIDPFTHVKMQKYSPDCPLL